MQAPIDTPLQPLSRRPSSLSLSSSSSSSSTSSSSSSSSVASLPFMRLDAYVVARSLVRLVCSASIADAELRDQATRAAKSALLNLAEGLPSDLPGTRRRYFRSADGSVHEVAAALDVSVAVGALDESVAQEGIALAARARALIRGLLR